MNIKRLLKQFVFDDGGTYSISVVFILPMYIAFLAFAIELILLFNSTQALTSSLQTAGHTTRAWVSHRDSLTNRGTSIEEVVHQAVARSMASFATTHVSESRQTDREFSRTIAQLDLSNQAVARYSAKTRAIENALRVEITPARRSTPGLLVTVDYDSPLWIPFFSSLLSDGRRGEVTYRTLSREIWVPLRNSAAERRTVGIPYSPKLVRQW